MLQTDSNLPAHVSKRTTDITGLRFGRLLVVRYNPNATPLTRWDCLCDCGNTVAVASGNLRSGRQQSCGCLKLERQTTHGMTGTRVHRIWIGMNQRCNNPNATEYENYGGRGISVCERWSSFESFYADVGDPPSTKHQLDRYPNMNGNYEPNNFRWATPKQQLRNSRRNHFLTAKDERLPIVERAERLNNNPSARAISGRKSRGWSDEEALGFVQRT